MISGAPIWLHTGTGLLLVTEAVQLDDNGQIVEGVPGVYYAGQLPTDSPIVITLTGSSVKTLDPKFLPLTELGAWVDQRIETVISAALEGDY